MKEPVNTVGGWIWYVSKIKETGVVLDTESVKAILKMYISSVPVDKAIEEIKNVSN